MPDRLHSNLFAWRRLHPEWTFITWRDHMLRWLENRDLYDAAPDLVPKDAIWQLRSDIARYELLYNYGGLYTDADVLPLQAFDDELDGHDTWAGMEDVNWVGNTILYVEPGHQVMKDILTGLRERIEQGARRKARPGWVSGPRYITQHWHANGCYTAPTRRVYPYSYGDVKRGSIPTSFDDDVLCVHQWFHTQQLLEAKRANHR